MIHCFKTFKSFVVFLFFAISAFAHAQSSVTVDVFKNDSSRAPAVVHYDSSQVKLRSFKKADIDRFLKDDDFLYDRKPPVTSIWDIIKEWFTRWFFKTSETKGFNQFWEIVMYILIAGTLIFINRELAKSTIKGLFYKSKKGNCF